MFRIFPCYSPDFARVYYEAFINRSIKGRLLIKAEDIRVISIYSSNNAIKS